jgi:hypothetical protein
MGDLVLGFFLLGELSVARLLLGCRLGRVVSVWHSKLLGLAAIIVLALYVTLLSDSLLLATLLPISNLIVVGNWVAHVLGFLGGLAWSLIPRQAVSADSGTLAPWLPAALRIRKLAVVLSLQAVGCYAVVRPIWGAAPRCKDQWVGDFGT